MSGLARVRICAPYLTAWSVCVLGGLGLAGCSGLASFSLAPETTQALQSPPGASEKLRASRPLLLVYLKPVIGVPPALQAQLMRALDMSALGENVTLLADQSAAVSINLQGYVMASRDHSSVKFTYVWHVSSQNGTRLGQVVGDESAAVSSHDGDPWAAFVPAMSERIAAQVIAGLISTVYPNSNSGSVASVPAR